MLGLGLVLTPSARPPARARAHTSVARAWELFEKQVIEGTLAIRLLPSLPSAFPEKKVVEQQTLI